MNAITPQDMHVWQGARGTQQDASGRAKPRAAALDVLWGPLTASALIGALTRAFAGRAAGRVAARDVA